MSGMRIQAFLAETPSSGISSKELQVQLTRWHGYADLVRLLDTRLEEARNVYETTVPASEFLRARVVEIRAFRKYVIEGDLE
jgi:hypothetical protein